VELYLPFPILLHGVYKDNFPVKVTSIERNPLLDRVLLFCFFLTVFLIIVLFVYNTVSDRTNINVLTYSPTYILTYLLTPWSRVLLEKLIDLQLAKKCPSFYDPPKFITAFTSARHLYLS